MYQIALYDGQYFGAVGSSTFEACISDLDGGAIYAITGIEFHNDGPSSSTFLSNKAGLSGGAIFAWHSLKLQFGYQALVFNNSAGLDGGGFHLKAGATMEVHEEGCPNAVCNTLSRGDGQCDLACMTRGCNWCKSLFIVERRFISDFSSPCRDNGDCEDRFVNAAQDAILECDRSKCSPMDQDYNVKCSETCFKASCDWSKSMCAKERSKIAQCPLFDSAVLHSIRSHFNQSLKFVRGGTARYSTIFRVVN